MKLILVESPTKARTLTKYLGKEYRVEATMGHIRDLPKSALGVDLEHRFTPHYVIPRDKKKRVAELQEYAQNAQTIILASDPDREGEAIAWHVAAILSDSGNQKSKIKNQKENTKKVKKAENLPISPSPNQNFQRITFHEITESAIKQALLHPGKIDMRLVDAQQARRILDRLVGYKLSPLLWKKLSRKWLSAGRVQSVTVRLIVEREREIEKFQKQPYFTIEGTFKGFSLQGKENPSQEITAQLFSHEGKKYEESVKYELFDGAYTVAKTFITSEKDANGIIADFQKPFTVSSVEKKEVRRFPPAPYTTSTLQQDAGRKLYFSAKKTMQVAQKLYEEGYITYHRTDSVHLSEKFLSEAREYIGHEYGTAYVPVAPRTFTTKSKVAQEAHEAIRPTEVHRSTSEVRASEDLNHDHVRLYELIWKRALASQVKEAIFDSTTILISSSNAYVFQTQGSVIKFEGFLKVLGKEDGEIVIPNVSEGETLDLKKAVAVPHETAPPPRYTEAALVKTLEEKDIGRPSTYAPIISTVIERQYVKKEEKKLVPTELGGLVTDFLVLYFSNIMSLPFTAKMEGSLDEIAIGEKDWQEVIQDFFDPFSEALMDAQEKAEKVTLATEKLDETCPTCGGGLLIRTGRYGKFVACSNFPTCKYTRQYGEKIDLNCPKCGHPIVVKRSKRGKTFYGCSNYPNCTFAAWKKEDIK
ncbi:MAG: topoisomerase I protein [Candidatus Gottesmanbacteria bacterium GW2011_GWB1_44_11c]|uniref:DNA topoisomerase 1 n=1 Tax=Candidatus Gottesmanbacteria bacterium GW2011_GWB1_44_11c TaxID=1618447 RepID=A0A0G1GJ44_9BACT|nr:MAG: topoisomerase I protein [Candidatus Gottesmanbacteria bacterium GW2011_GWB1_44_11c]